MATPTVLEKSFQEFIKQGHTLREIQRGMTELCSRVGDFERKRGDWNTRERNIISKIRKLLGNENKSDEDSEFEISNEETPHHIPDTQQPSTSKGLDISLSDGELDSKVIR